MKIIFYENRYGDWTDKLIRWKTATWKQRFDGSWKDLPSHVELLMSSGLMFSASQYENEVRYKMFKYSNAWTIIDLNTDVEQDKHIRNFCANENGKKYDYRGILGFLIPFVDDNRDKWFCSEICAEALKQVGYLDIEDSAKISPAKLKELIDGLVK